ncbi:MAG TPA: glycogen synthase GlgA [Erysipelotrichaceae bacterium]|nr:glycogen synthase GlgA [Erysipelotrichaceae bacterium]
MKGVLFAASEGLPFIKSGGLADVIGSLPQCINDHEFKVAVVMPLYKKIMDNFELEEVGGFHVQSGLIDKEALLYHTGLNGIDYYFIRQDDYFNRDGMYGFVDDGERFAFYNKAVLEMLPLLPFEVDIIHSHDWHTGMIPILCKQEYRDKKYHKIKHVYTIHNLLFQGNYPKEITRYFNLDYKFYQYGDIKFDDGVSFMKAAITYADKVTTVSESYAKEILTEEFGERMQHVLKSREADLVGIVNGIDTEIWNPKTDKYIPANYSVNALANKKKCKKELQKRLGLRVADDVMLVGMVSRLTWQKGAALLIERMSQIMGQDIQLVILGTGDSYIENQFKRIEYDYPHRAVFYCGYSEELAHDVYAGVDLFLMPSLFEPCGISQLISMRYGTLPLVRETGGLRDTVIPYNEYDKTGTGFSFKNFNGDELVHVLKYAIHTYYYKPNDWKKLVRSAMKKDVSWQFSAKKYKDLYRKLV